jgi:SMC interacting uncharacterized protein involved in chromosome segregation
MDYIELNLQYKNDFDNIIYEIKHLKEVKKQYRPHYMYYSENKELNKSIALLKSKKRQMINDYNWFCREAQIMKWNVRDFDMDGFKATTTEIRKCFK